MLNNIEIKNFRGIKHLTIDNFKNINIFLGKANTGKTSVIEAIACGITKNANSLMLLSYFRGIIRDDDIFESLFYDYNINIPIMLNTKIDNDNYNIEISPYEVVPGAEKMIWWKCSKGHSWQTYLFQRTGKKKSGCPFCAHLQVYEEISLAHCYPDTLIWWDQKANAPITPHDITAYSNKKFYFQCPVCNHSFKRSPNEFVQLMKENRCPK